MENNAPAPARSALSATQIISRLAGLNGWKLHGDGSDLAIEKTYHFKDFLHTMAFVNALAYLAEQKNHHPEILLRYNACSVRYNTHDVQGLSSSDFECAALVDALAHPGTA